MEAITQRSYIQDSIIGATFDDETKVTLCYIISH
jgi:hypothetical protein